MDLLEKNLNDTRMPDVSKEFSVGIGKVQMDLSNQKLTSFSVNKDASAIVISDNTPHMQFQIRGVNLNFEMQYQMQSKPTWVSDKGRGIVSIEDLSIFFAVSPFNSKGRMQVDVQDTLIDVKDYNANFEGSSDFTKVFNIILRNFKNFFKNEVASVIAMKVSTTFEESANRLLYSGPSMVALSDTNVHVNYTLAADPVFTNDYMAIPFDGGFVKQVDGKLKQGPAPSGMPSYFNQGKMVQVFVSESSLNSALLAAHELDLLKLEQGDVLSTVVGMIFDSYEKIYGSAQKTQLYLETYQGTPTLKITQNEIVIEANTKIHIKNPYNFEYDAAEIKALMNVQIDMEVTQNFNLTGKVKAITFTVEDVKTYFESESTVEDVQERIELFVAPVQSTLNLKLKKGIVLPVPDLIVTDLSDSELIQFDGYIMIQADPKVINADKKLF